jgi:hypothetical protein
MKLLRACALVIAIACTAQAGDMQFPVNSPAPDIGTELIVFFSLWF